MLGYAKERQLCVYQYMQGEKRWCGLVWQCGCEALDAGDTCTVLDVAERNPRRRGYSTLLVLETIRTGPSQQAFHDAEVYTIPAARCFMTVALGKLASTCSSPR
jgi:hypothetical protein